AWIKCHYPQAFLVALLNSQPMGFYSPSQLVQDARRHGVQVLPVDVSHSGWEARVVSLDANEQGGGVGTKGLHDTSETLRTGKTGDVRQLDTLGVRLGRNLVKGLSREAARRIESASESRPFASLADLARRAALERG